MSIDFNEILLLFQLLVLLQFYRMKMTKISGNKAFQQHNYNWTMVSLVLKQVFGRICEFPLSSSSS